MYLFHQSVDDIRLESPPRLVFWYQNEARRQAAFPDHKDETFRAPDNPDHGTGG